MESGGRSPREEALTAEFGQSAPLLAASAGVSTDQDESVGGGLLGALSQDTQKILAAAHEQARQLGHSEIHPEHLLLALLLMPGDRAARTLLRVAGGNRDDLVTLREALVERLRTMPARTGHEVTLSNGCKRVLQEAVAEATRLGRGVNARVEPRHVLFGLISEGGAFLGSRLTTSLALRGLRMAIGISPLRPGRTSGPGGPDGPELPVAPGKLPPHRVESSAAPATRDNVITFRVTDSELAAVDALIETGVMRTRSEASGWLLRSGITANSEYFEQINRIGEEIARLRQEVQQLTEARFGATTATPETSPGPIDEPANA